jgi:hypothetical protein
VSEAGRYAGMAANSGLGGPIALQPVTVRGGAVSGIMPAHGGQLAQRLVAGSYAYLNASDTSSSYTAGTAPCGRFPCSLRPQTRVA